MVDIVGAFAWRTHRLGRALKRRLDNDRAWVRWLVDAILLPSDVLKIRRSHKSGHGTYPHILRPRTFNEYLHHAKIFQRKKITTQLSDKIAVREYVKERIGEDYLTRLYWTGVDLGQVDRTTLPRAFVIKSNNGSGTNIIVNDKNALDWNDALTKTRAWLQSDHSVHYGEWQYRWIKPQLLIEEHLGASDGTIPDDIKIYCFHGKPVFCLIVTDRYGTMMKDFVNTSCKPLEISRDGFKSNGKINRPEAWAEMIGFAEKLSKGLEFSRVDFYCIPNVIFGEITFTPEAGIRPFQPEKYDRLIYETFLSPRCAHASGKDKPSILQSREGA